MALTLRQKQSVFMLRLARLILKANELGYELTGGELYRSREEAERLALEGKGIKNSLHTQRLAIDLNLFKDGKWLTSTAAHRPLGEWWEALSDDAATCVWGGSWGHDGNHYAIAHGGRK